MVDGVASPKLQDQPTMLPPETIDESLKSMGEFKHTLVEPKLATGIGNMVIAV